MANSDKTQKASWAPFAALLLVVVAVLGGGGIFLVKMSMSDGSMPEERSATNPVTIELPEKYPRGDKQAPEFALVDQHGKTVNLTQFRGSPLLLTFAFAHCTTMCPGVIQTVKSVKTELGTELPVTIFVTIDPERDKPDTLAATSGRWGLSEGMHFVSGEPALVSKVLDQYDIPRSTDASNGEITHPALVYVIDADGKLAYSFSNPTKRWLVDAVRKVSGTSVN